MKYYRNDVLKDLRDYVIEVHFTKVSDNTPRVLRCTLRQDMLPQPYSMSADTSFHHDNPEHIVAWDVMNAGWRSFRMDTVNYVQNVNENYV